MKTPKLEKLLRVEKEIKATHIRFPQTSRWPLLVKRSYTCSTPKLPVSIPHVYIRTVSNWTNC
jgi:hypothetical protein